jgi:transcriptional regulator with XRE-family HTH domain
MQRDARRRFGQEFKKARLSRGLTQAEILEHVCAGVGTTLEGNWLSRVEAGRVVKLDRQSIEALVEALGDDSLRARALFAAAGLSPIPVRDWDTALALGYLAEVAETYIEELAAVARSALQTPPEQRPPASWAARQRQLVARLLESG